MTGEHVTTQSGRDERQSKQSYRITYIYSNRHWIQCLSAYSCNTVRFLPCPTDQTPLEPLFSMFGANLNYYLADFFFTSCKKYFFTIFGIKLDTMMTVKKNLPQFWLRWLCLRALIYELSLK